MECASQELLQEVLLAGIQKARLDNQGKPVTNL